MPRSAAARERSPPEASRARRTRAASPARDQRSTVSSSVPSSDGWLAEAELLLRPLHRRVGTISPDRRERVLSLSFERLEGLGDALLEFSSLSELDAWLDAPPAEPTTGG